MYLSLSVDVLLRYFSFILRQFQSYSISIVQIEILKIVLSLSLAIMQFSLRYYYFNQIVCQNWSVKFKVEVICQPRIWVVKPSFTAIIYAFFFLTSSTTYFSPPLTPPLLWNQKPSLPRGCSDKPINGST